MSTVSATNLSLKAAALFHLSALLPLVTPLEAFARPTKNFSRERLGETVLVPVYAGSIDADEFDETTRNYINSTGSGTQSTDGVPVELTSHLITDVTRHSLVDLVTGAVDINEVVRIHLSGLIGKVTKNCFGDISVANFGAIAAAVAQANFDIDDLVDYEVACNDLNWSSMGRKLVISDGYLGNMKKGSLLVAMQNTTDGADVVANKFKPLHGFDILPSNDIKQSVHALDAEKLRGFVTDGNAIAFATAYPPNSTGMGSTLQVQRLSIGGISVQIKVKFDDDVEKVCITAETFFGKKVLRAAGLKRILST
jgi:hypothetical protein